MKNVKRIFRIVIKAKECKKKFKEDFEPGVLAFREIEFNLPEREYERPAFARHLLSLEKEFLDECIETYTEEVKSNGQ